MPYPQIAPGQIYRDTYGDKRRTDGVLCQRRIRVISQEPDGRWLVQGITEWDGAPVEHGRKTRVSEKTLATGYEFVPPPVEEE